MTYVKLCWIEGTQQIWRHVVIAVAGICSVTVNRFC